MGVEVLKFDNCYFNIDYLFQQACTESKNKVHLVQRRNSDHSENIQEPPYNTKIAYVFFYFFIFFPPFAPPKAVNHQI